MQKLIVIRGPSGAGKSSIAAELQERSSEPALLVSEDKVRRLFSDWKQPKHDASKRMVANMVITGLKENYHVIYEGISNIKTHRPYFDEILASHPSSNFFFYLDVSFEETLKRHSTRPNNNEFGEAEMKTWWEYATPTGYEFETTIPETSTFEETVATIARVAGLALR